MNSTMTFILRDDQRMENCIAYLRSEGLGKQVTIGPVRKSRQQESYWHACLKIISDYMGEGIEDLKTRLKFEWLPLKQATGLNGKAIVYPVSTTGLDKKAYSELIDKTLLLGQQLGLTMPMASHFGLEEK